ncbi:unnamed protein product [Sphagnum jensenii]|uniref:Uncharacterized protein n=1 Tax=Sphagnum jensenii TaxID=128206 RepID=A0ABP0VTR2_9BRYO
MHVFWEGVFTNQLDTCVMVFNIFCANFSTMCGNGQLKHVAIPMDLAFLPSSNSNIVYFIENPVASIVDDVGGFNPSQKKEGILRSGKTFLTLVG